MDQVAQEFRKKLEDMGAKKAAKALNVSVPSFYNYAAGTDLPRMEVLRAAKEKWGIRWRHLDPSEIVPPMKVKSAEQLVFSFLDALREEDIEVVEVGPEGKNILHISLKVRFPS